MIPSFHVHYSDGVVEFDDSVSFIESGTFSQFNPKKVIIGKNVVKLLSGAFNRCPMLEEVEVNSNNKYYSSENGILYDKAKTKLLFCPESYGYVEIPRTVKEICNGAFRNNKFIDTVTFPNSIEIVGHEAFNNCLSLENVTMSNNISKLGDGIFAYCKKLKKIVLPNNIKWITYGMFIECESLTNITIPKSVTDIHASVFDGCINLEELHISENVYQIGMSTFRGCDKLKLYVKSKNTILPVDFPIERVIYE